MNSLRPTIRLLAVSIIVVTAALGCSEKIEPDTNQPAIRCGDGTHLDDGECIPDAADPSDDSGSPGDSGGPSVPPDTGESSDTGEPADTGGSDGPEAPTKSPKRGLAYNLTNPADFEAIESGVSWWYNWYFQTDAPADAMADHRVEFIPMLWGHNSEADYVSLETWLMDRPDVNDVLVLNEPNLVDQANILPSDAVEHWLRYEQFQAEMLANHGRSIRLVGPAMTWGTMLEFADPVDWLNAFYAAFNASEGRDPVIDALAFHWYDYGLEEQLSRLESFGKTFWVTEMANWHTEPGWTIDSPAKQIDTMIDMVSICESRADVDRYAWFMGRWDPDPHFTSVFGPEPGSLTEVGHAYLEQPW